MTDREMLEMLVEGQKQIFLRLDGVDSRLDGIDNRLDGIDDRLDGIDVRLDGIDRELLSKIVRIHWRDVRDCWRRNLTIWLM